MRAALLTIVLSATALAADPALPTESDAPLAGPRITGTAAGPTLIERDEYAKVRRLDLRPEEAALDKLGLTSDTLAPARKVIDDRAIALDRVITKHRTLVERLGPAFESGRALEGAALLLELHTHFLAVVGPAPLADKVAEALPEQSRDQYRALVKDYNDAVAKDLAAANPDAKKNKLSAGLAKLGARTQLAIEHFVIELQRSGERIFSEKSAIDTYAEAFLAKMKLPEADEAQVRTIFTEWAVTLNGNEPTKRQLADLLLQIYDTLDESQRRAYFEAVIMSED